MLEYRQISPEEAFEWSEEEGVSVGVGCLPKILRDGLMATGQRRVRI